MTFQERAEQLAAEMTLEERALMLCFDSPPVKRLGIPAYHWWNEGLHGVARAGTATMFPQAIAMAAMFDADEMEKIGDIISTEARAKFNASRAEGDYDIYKGLTLWSPNINIFRDCRWGRGQETYGEDPYLTGRLGVRFIRGIQGHGKYLKAAACAKHFAVHSGPEELRHEFNAVVSPKDLWETYLYAFEECVKEGGVEGVMGAYNRVNGEPCCGSKTLIQEILRGKWGFGGYYTSDCWAIKDFHENHKVTKNALESVALALRTGCDINCGSLYHKIMEAYQAGLVTEEDITRCAVRALRTRLRLGLLADDCEYDQIPYYKVACREHRAEAIRAAEKSLVLLKNDGVLPLPKTLSSLAVIGPNADSKWPLIANYHGTAPRYVTVLDGIEDLVGSTTRVYYSEGSHTVRDSVEKLALPDDRISEAVTIAKLADMTVVCVGLDERYEGEQQDIGNRFDEAGSVADKATVRLPDSQIRLLQALIETGRDLVVVNMTGSAVDLQWLDSTENVRAILQGWYPGAEGGRAIASVLFGDANPSGKLPITFYRDAAGMPAITDYSMKNRTYRYLESEPLYPFGYGLSYTQFRYSDAAAEYTEAGWSVSVTIENTGRFCGEEVVQVYLKDLESRYAVRNHALCAFGRVCLAPGEKKQLTLPIREKAFEIVDEQGQRRLDSHCFRIFVGGSQPDSRSCSLMGTAPLELTITRE